MISPSDGVCPMVSSMKRGTSDLASTLEGGQQTRSVTRGSARATTLLTALGITILEPPAPPKRAETVME